MPVNKEKSNLAALIGDKAKKAHENHKTDTTKWGLQQLPAGIVGGVAQINKAYWSTYKDGNNLGKPYVYLGGIVKSPARFKDMDIEGQIVSRILPLCETAGFKPKSFDDNYAEVLNALRQLGVDTSESSFDDLESILNTLQEEQPHTKFSTRGWTPPASKANPNPTEMVFVQFDGVTEWHGAEANGKAPALKDNTKKPSKANANADGADPDAAEQGDSGEDNIDELVALAEADDGDAQDKLKAIAGYLDIDGKKVDNAPSWTAVGNYIKKAQAEAAGESGEPEAGDDELKKGDVVKFKPFDKMTKKPAKKAIDCEVIVVNKAKGVVTIKSLVDMKTLYKEVPIDQLGS